jgi:ergothioneine biosynthesis protein EgtB
VSTPGAAGARASALAARLSQVRAATSQLCAPLAIEDYGVQSMSDASPTKWHLAHTTWFFETFVLAPHAPGYLPYREGWDYLFNSYYEAVGPRHPRPQRGLLTRPTVAEVYAYRAAVDEQLAALLARSWPERAEVLDLIELGIQHEQQHQELILTDLQHALSCNPLQPAYRSEALPPPACAAAEREFLEHSGGLCTIGHDGEGFAFDNEAPAHRVHLPPFALCTRLVTAGEFAEFIADGGYTRASLWLAEGWNAVLEQGLVAPLYWEQRDRTWCRFSLHGVIPIDPHAPVCHVSFYEADAYARWADLRLPTEAEWEVVARDLPLDGQFIEHGPLVPLARPAQRGLCGGVWTWTQSPYTPYPGFAPARDALGEYNGKFMINQLVLRGGSCFSPASHIRPSYRNFFPAHARWQATGIRLARSVS